MGAASRSSLPVCIEETRDAIRGQMATPADWLRGTGQDADGVDVESGPRTVRDASGRLRVASGEAGAGQYVGDPNATGSRTRPRPDHVATAGDVQDPRQRPLPADHPAVTRRVEAGELPADDPTRLQQMRTASESSLRPIGKDTSLTA